MEAYEQIKNWLNSRQDYAAGLALAKAQGVTGFTLQLLESGGNDVTKKKLLGFLTKALDQLKPGEEAPAARPAAEQAPVATTPTPVDVPTAPELVELRRQRGHVFKLANHHFEQMRAAEEGEPRRLHAVQVKVLTRENTRLWDAERYYEQFGFLPPVGTVATIDRTDLRAVERRRNTLRTYVSDAKQGKRGKADPTKPAAWQAELMELDRILADG